MSNRGRDAAVRGQGSESTGGSAPAPGRSVLTSRHVQRAASSAGEPLPVPLAERLEATLGTGLDEVRVHTGSPSAASARALGANAYAVGQDIHFAEGRYDPGSAAGQFLIAHEVAHTVQQRGASAAPQCSLEVSSPGDA